MGEDADETTAQSVNEPDQPTGFVPRDVAEYDRFEKIDGGTYERANEFLRDRTYVTACEWAPRPKRSAARERFCTHDTTARP